MKKILALALSTLLCASIFAGCKDKEDDVGNVYFFNFKPEQAEAYQEIAKKYTELTGVEVKVETAAAGTYEQTLKSEMAKSDAPTLFQINGPIGYASWKDYCLDLSDIDAYKHLMDKSIAITDGDGVYGLPIAIEGYGIIYNKKIMNAYMGLEGAKISSVDEIVNFDKLKEVVEDMQARKDELGIEGVFACTSLKSGEEWRWQTHLANVPIYYEFKNNNVDLSDSEATMEINFQYAEGFKNLFDLYMDNSTIDKKLLGSKAVTDSMAEFALGKAAMVQNGNWAYVQISDVPDNTVAAEDVAFLPMFIGVDGEEGQGLCIGTENFMCVNKKASEADQKASIDFFNWLYTSDEGKDFVTNSLGFIAPYDTFGDDEKPTDPLAQNVLEWSAKENTNNVPWNFTVFPSQQFKNDFGAALLEYAQGTKDWNDVVDLVISEWKTEKENAQG